MPRDTLIFATVAVLLLTFLTVIGTPFDTVALGQGEPIDACCSPSNNHAAEPSQPCNTATECFCLCCLHIDLRQTALVFTRPLSIGVSVFPMEPSILSDFSQTIDYPPDLS